MSYTRAQVAQTIDHAVLKPFATTEDILAGCRMCHVRGVKSLCVRPSDVATAAEALKDSPVEVGVVVGFPHGSNVREVKVLEALRAIESGANEIDMVMNVGQFLSGNFEVVKLDIASVVEAAHEKGALVKVILETCYLTLDQVREASLMAADAGADFVKTSTGFGDGGATPEVIQVMLDAVGDRIGVKASGGVRDWETAVGYLKQGCTRLGVGSTEAVLDGGPE